MPLTNIRDGPINFVVFIQTRSEKQPKVGQHFKKVFMGLFDEVTKGCLGEVLHTAPTAPACGYFTFFQSYLAG